MLVTLFPLPPIGQQKKGPAVQGNSLNKIQNGSYENTLAFMAIKKHDIFVCTVDYRQGAHKYQASNSGSSHTHSATHTIWNYINTFFPHPEHGSVG